MRKKACSFFPIAAALAVSSLCGSCKGGRLSLAAVEPHVVYDFSTGEAGDQYLVVFVRTEGGGDVDAVSLACQADSLCWHGMSVSKVSEDCFFSVFSPAPGAVMQPADYRVTVTDCYGDSDTLSFSLRYDADMASRASPELLGAAGYLRRYAYFDGTGCLAIFDEIDKDGSIQKANKHIGGKRLCCISPDGNTVCLFPREEIY